MNFNQGSKQKLFFLVSGEHPTLPKAELRAILESEHISFKELDGAPQVVRLLVDSGCVDAVVRRSAFVRVCCLELFTCPADFDTILRCAREVDYGAFLRAGMSFAVRVRRVRGSCQQIDSLELERRLGDAIPYKGVDLVRPDRLFFGVLSDNLFFFGLKLAEIRPGVFVERRPSRRPFFHPTSMPAKLARCMVNLTRPEPENLIFDPFCGTGSLLLEAGLMGYQTIGADVQKRMILGARLNLTHYGVEPQALIVSDALNSPVRRADRIATDPPYGRSATTLGLDVKRLVSDFLQECPEILPRKGYICLATPKSLEVRSLGEDAGLKHLESHFIYIHRGLTREIAVFLRP